MEKKSSKLTVVLLIIAVIIIALMGCYIYKLNTEKIANIEEIEELTNELKEKENENEVEEDENEIEQLVIEGDYSLDASDFGYTFTKDGKITESGNVHEARGTYKTIAENMIEAVFTEETVWDVDTGEKKLQK